MALITQVPQPNIWEEICKEYEAQRPPFETQVTKGPISINYEANLVTPIFYGRLHKKIDHKDSDLLTDFDPQRSHPACLGHTFVEKHPPTPPVPEPHIPDRKICPPGTYLEHYVFPYLLPAMEEMMKRAKKEKCFERKRTKFNALDFLTEYLYKNNVNKPKDGSREGISLFDIPFVKRHLRDHPRPPLPLSLIWTEEEAALIIQSHWRGYVVRKVSEVQELRQWQKEWREDNANIRIKVNDFWADKMPAEPPAGKDATRTAEPEATSDKKT